MHTLAFVENIFFLVLIAIVGLIRWISTTAEAKKNADAAKRVNPPTSTAPLPRAPAQTEEERIRRFMEALGVPTSTAAPQPKAERREFVPKTPREVKRKVRPIDPFPRPRVGPWSPEPVVVVPPPPVVVSTPPPVAQTPLPTRETTVLKSTAAPQNAPAFEVQLLETEESVSFAPAISWAARLGTASGLRDAVILREIFGPPRSMQSVEQDLLTKI